MKILKLVSIGCLVLSLSGSVFAVDQQVLAAKEKEVAQKYYPFGWSQLSLEKRLEIAKQYKLFDHLNSDGVGSCGDSGQSCGGGQHCGWCVAIEQMCCLGG